MAGRESFRPSRSDETTMVKLPDSLENPGEKVVVDLEGENKGKIAKTEWKGPSATGPDPVDGEGTDKFQKRIDRLRAEVGTHDRRATAAERERDTLAQQLRDTAAENQRLKESQQRGTTALANSMMGERKALADDATRRLEQAHAVGDSAAIAKATADLTKANAELAVIETRAPRETPQAERQQAPAERPQEQQQPTNGQPAFAPATARWLDHNKTWWNRDRQKTAKALSLHYELESEGITPDKPEYTREVDKRLQQAYPDHEAYEIDTSDPEDSRRGDPPPRRTDSAERGGREAPIGQRPNDNQVVLTQLQVDFAKRHRIPLEKMAENVKADQLRNGGAR